MSTGRTTRTVVMTLMLGGVLANGLSALPGLDWVALPLRLLNLPLALALLAVVIRARRVDTADEPPARRRR